MLQFAHVPGPGVAAQGFFRAGAEPQAAQAQARTVAFQEAARQQQDVIAAFSQWGNRHRIDRQPVIQIGPECAVAHALAQVAVGGGDHPRVDMAWVVGAKPLDFAVLQRAQQLGLHREGQLAHLVEKQRAAVGGLEAARALAHRAGERALDVAEQLAFGQRFRQRRAVDMHQRAIAPARQAMQPVREQLLAHAGFAKQQDRQLGVGHDLQLMQQLVDGRALADDLPVVRGGIAGRQVAAGRAQRADLGLEPRGARGGFDHDGQLAQLGLRIGVEGADLERVERERAPQLPFDMQADAHAVVHRQRRAGLFVDQPVVRIGQGAVMVEACHAAPREDGRQARMLPDHEAPAQRIAHQPIHGNRPQVVFFQSQQRHRSAAEMRAQAADQPLHAHRRRQIGDQIGQEQTVNHGWNYLKRVKRTLACMRSILPRQRQPID